MLICLFVFLPKMKFEIKNAFYLYSALSVQGIEQIFIILYNNCINYFYKLYSSCLYHFCSIK